MGLTSEEDCRPPVIRELRIVMLGKTGSGKSATGNTILNEEAFASEISPSSVTKSSEKATHDFVERTVSVIDTPGIFDTSITEAQLKCEIEKCVSLSIPGPHIFLLVMRVDARFTEEEENALKWIMENFGEEASNYTLVLFTRGDQLQGKTIETYLDKSPKLKNFVSGSTAGYIVFDNTRRENRTQVGDLFEKIDKIVHQKGNHYTVNQFEEAQKKLKSKQWWSKWGNRVNNLGTNLFVAATASAAPAAGAAVMAEEAVAVSIGSYLMFAGGAMAKAMAGWITPKTGDSQKKS